MLSLLGVFTSALLFWSLDSRHVIVDSEEHATAVDGGLDDLSLDQKWLPNVHFSHVSKDSSVSVNSEEHSILLGVFGSQSGQNSDDIGTAVLSKSSWDSFQSESNSSVWLLLEATHGLGVLIQLVADGHFSGSSSRNHLWASKDVSGNTESIMDVSLHFIKGILRATSEQNGAGRWVLGFNEVGEVLVADLLDLEQAAVISDIALLDLFWSVDDGGSSNSGDSVVVSLSNSKVSG